MAETENEIDKKVMSFSKLEATMKKKNRNSWFGMNSSSLRYFQFHCNGRIFSYSHKKPTTWLASECPSFAMYVRNIDTITYSQKNKGEFIIESKFCKKMNQCNSNEAKANEWVNALTYLRDHYKNQPREPWESNDSGKITPEVKVQIMKEYEQFKFNDDYAQVTNITKVFDVKKIRKYFDRVGWDILNTRMCHSYVLYCAVNYDKADNIKKISRATVNENNQDQSQSVDEYIENIEMIGGINLVMPKNMVLNKRHWCILITQKDVDDLEDDQILGNENYPLWMDNDVIYIFEYSNDNDNSFHKRTLYTKDILSFEIIENDSAFDTVANFMNSDRKNANYMIRIAMQDKAMFFVCNSATECDKWMKLISKSKKNVEEISRTKNHILRRNVDALIRKYRFQDLDLQEWVESDYLHIFEGITTESDREDWLEHFEHGIDHFDKTLDALQAQRPFYRVMFEYYLKEFYLKMITFASQFWNKRFKEFSPGDIIYFVGLLKLQNKVINEYGLHNSRIEHSFNEVVGTFTVRMFKNIMPMIQELLNGMKINKDANTEPNGNQNSDAPVYLFKFINTVFENYSISPYPLVLRAILGLIFKLLSNFQKEYKTLVEECEELKIETLCTLTNLSLKFISKTRDFVQVVCTISEEEKEVVESHLSYQHVIRGWANVSNSAFQRIQKTIKTKQAEAFKSIKDYRLIDMEILLNHFSERLIFIMNMLNSNYAKKLWKIIWEDFTQDYVRIVLVTCHKYNPDDVQLLATKLKDDVQLIRNVFSSFVPKKTFELHDKKLDIIQSLFVCPVTEFVACIGSQKIALGLEFSENYIKVIMSFRKDFSHENIKNIFGFLESQKQQFQKKNTERLSKTFVASIDSQICTRKFVDKIRGNLDKKAHLKQEDPHDSVSKLPSDQRCQFLEKAIQLTQIIMFSIKRFPSTPVETKPFFLKTLMSLKFRERHFWFGQDIMCWSNDKDEDQTLEGRIYLAGIKDDQVYLADKKLNNDNIYFYFRFGMDLYVLKFRDEYKMKEWVKAIQVLKEESLNEQMPTKFNKIEAVGNSDMYKEQFDRDNVDFSYDGIKFLRMKKKQNTRFSLSDCDVNLNENLKKIEKNIMDREDSFLSDSFLEDEDGVEEQGKEEEKENEEGVMTNVMKWFGW